MVTLNLDISLAKDLDSLFWRRPSWIELSALTLSCFLRSLLAAILGVTSILASIYAKERSKQRFSTRGPRSCGGPPGFFRRSSTFWALFPTFSSGFYDVASLVPLSGSC